MFFSVCCLFEVHARLMSQICHYLCPGPRELISRNREKKTPANLPGYERGNLPKYNDLIKIAFGTANASLGGFELMKYSSTEHNVSSKWPVNQLLTECHTKCEPDSSRWPSKIASIVVFFDYLAEIGIAHFTVPLFKVRDVARFSVFFFSRNRNS